MKQNLLNKFRLRAVMLVALMCTAFTGAWADDSTSTLTFSAKCNGSGTADDDVAWTVTSDGTESNYDSGKGIHYGTSSAQVKYIQLSTSDIEGTITEVVVNASTASGVSATVSVTVGGEAFGGDPKTLSSSAYNYQFKGSASGEIVVRVEKPSKAYKALYVKSVKVTYTPDGGGDDQSVATTVTIDASGITNTNVYEGTAAGSLAATVSAGETAIDGATVTWSGNNDEVATINASTGAVTLVAAGKVTFKAEYAGEDGVYKSSSKTYEMTVTNSDPNAPGTENNPYSVADAIKATPTSGTSDNVYIHGFVSAFYNTSIVGDGTYYRYYISDDGTTANQLLVFKGTGLDKATFSNATDLQVGDEVVICGGLTTYSNAPEVAAGNYIVSLVRIVKPATPEFTITAGTYTETQSVELSCKTEDAAIYYTIDGTEPTTESTLYTGAIEVSTTTTIKAIAVKDGVASAVATATYTINKTPFIDLGKASVNVTAEGAEGSIEVTYKNLTEVLAEVKFYEFDGTTEATYDWLDAEINNDNNVEYLVEENTDTNARTAYLKVYAIGNEGEAYSELITITQAGYVVDWATLPFSWEGSSTKGKSDLLDMTGVTDNGLGSDYAAGNAPYRIKLDGTGDYIQVKTDCQPVLVTMDVKMLGGATTSKITVQESSDGKTFTDVEDLTISGKQNTVLYLQTANAFKADTRYVRLYFTKGSNVGLGGITIEKEFEEIATVGAANYATYVPKYNVSFPGEVEAYITSVVNTEKGYVSMTQVTAVPKGTPVVLKNEGEYVLAPAAADALADVSSNQLKVSDGTVEGDGTIYVLAKPENEEVGFYLVNDDTAVTAGKAYLEIANADVKAFTFKFDDDPTSINEVNGQCSMVNGQLIYNLAGQRVSKMQRGINIVNGKKILR